MHSERVDQVVIGLCVDMIHYRCEPDPTLDFYGSLSVYICSLLLGMITHLILLVLVTKEYTNTIQSGLLHLQLTW